LNVARAWGAALIGEPVVSAVGDMFLHVTHAFVPLAIARAISVLGVALSGPTEAGYRYAPGSSAFREIVLDIMCRAFDLSQLAIPNSELATNTNV